MNPESERPAAWTKSEDDALQEANKAEKTEKTQNSKGEPNPFLDDKMLDTIQLEAETLHEDNSYQTHSWEMDPENDTRKLRTIPFDQIEEKRTDADSNPYDTGEHRRSWKD